MNDESKNLLLATQASILKKRAERKNEKEAIINNFFKRILKNSNELSNWLVETIINNYLGNKEKKVRWLYQDSDYDGKDEDKEYCINLTDIYSIVHWYNSSTPILDKDITKEDSTAIELLDEKDLKIPDLIAGKENYQKNLYVWKSSNPPKVATILSSLFEKYGIRIEREKTGYGIVIVKVLAKNKRLIEYFAKKALANELTGPFDLDENTINELKKQLEELEEKERKIIQFKELSKTNADLIQAKVLKELLNKYNDDSLNIYADREIETVLNVVRDNNPYSGNIFNVVDESYQNIIRNYKKSYNDLPFPSIIAIPYQENTDQKSPTYTYLPMFSNDLDKAMREIHVSCSYSFKEDNYHISIVEEELENFILGDSANSEKKASR